MSSTGIHAALLSKCKDAASMLDIRLSEALWYMPKRGMTFQQKGMRKRLSVEVDRVRELRRYLDELEEE